MEKKELIVVFILGVLVAVAATVRFFSIPLATSADRPKPTPSRRPTPVKGARGTLAVTPAWPPLAEHALPTDPAARRLYDAAETLADEAVLDAAIAAYKHFIQKFPNEPVVEVAILRVAQCSTMAHLYKEAAEHYELHLQRYPESALRPMALLWSAESLLRLGQREPARRRLAEVIAKYPASPFVEGAKTLLAALDRPQAPPSGPPAKPKSP